VNPGVGMNLNASEVVVWIGGVTSHKMKHHSYTSCIYKVVKFYLAYILLFFKRQILFKQTSSYTRSARVAAKQTKSYIWKQ
jgi:hypothetical protein